MEGRRSGQFEQEKADQQQADVNGHVPLGLILSSSAGHRGHTSRRPVIELDLISKLDHKPLLLAGNDEEAGRRLFTSYSCHKTLVTSQALGSHQKSHHRVGVVGKHTTAGDAVHYHPYPPLAVPRPQLPLVLPADIWRPYLPYSFSGRRMCASTTCSRRWKRWRGRWSAPMGATAVAQSVRPGFVSLQGGSPTTMLDMVEAAEQLAGRSDGGHSAGAARFHIATGGAGGPLAMMNRTAAVAKLADWENGGHVVGAARFRTPLGGAGGLSAMLGLPGGGRGGASKISY